MAKCVLKVAGQEAKEACGMEQIFGGMDSGNEGGIHAMRFLWQQHAQEEDWEFFHVYA